MVPALLGESIIIAAQGAKIAHDRKSGRRLWSTAADGGGWFVHALGPVVVTDKTDRDTGESWVVGLHGTGQVAWTTAVGGWIQASEWCGDGTVAFGPVRDDHWFLAFIDASGALTTQAMPTEPWAGSTVRRLSTTDWCCAASAPRAGDPPLLRFGPSGVIVARDVLPQVFGLVIWREMVFSIERQDRNVQLVARTSALEVLWRKELATESAVMAGDTLVTILGPPEDSVPVGLDPVTGDVRWRGDRLPRPGVHVSSSGDYVRVQFKRGNALYHQTGRLIAIEDRRCGEFRVDGQRLYLVIDDALTCLELP
jgi:hypothetical protein